MDTEEFEYKHNLSDYGLTEDDLKLYEKQTDEWQRHCKQTKEDIASRNKTVRIVSAIVCIVLFILAYIAGINENTVLLVIFGILFILSSYGMFYNKSATINQSDKYKFIDKQLELKVNEYNYHEDLLKKWEQLENDQKNVPNLIGSFNTISIFWEYINEMRGSLFSNSITCLEIIGAFNFVAHYYIFKCGDRWNIKDCLSNTHYYIATDILTEMVLYIFKTNNHRNILKYIIDNKESLGLTDQNYNYTIQRAKTILEKDKD